MCVFSVDGDCRREFLDLHDGVDPERIEDLEVSKYLLCQVVLGNMMVDHFMVAVHVL